MDICVQVFVWAYVSALLGLYLGEARLGQTLPLVSEGPPPAVRLCPCFLRPPPAVRLCPCFLRPPPSRQTLPLRSEDPPACSPQRLPRFPRDMGAWSPRSLASTRGLSSHPFECVMCCVVLGPGLRRGRETGRGCLESEADTGHQLCLGTDGRNGGAGAGRRGAQ